MTHVFTVSHFQYNPCQPLKSKFLIKKSGQKRDHIPYPIHEPYTHGPQSLLDNLRSHNKWLCHERFSLHETLS
jgi:hypothetical protein